LADKTRRVFLLLVALTCWQPYVLAGTDSVCIVITGLGGVPEYEENFQKWGAAVEQLCSEQISAEVHRLDGANQRKAEILKVFERVVQSESQELWFFLIGHANFDARKYRFNIKGPDLTGAELALFFDSLGSRKAYAVLATSSSGALLPVLTANKRVILSATKSARERHPPLFMSFFLEGSEAAEADLNKDGRVSLEEIFRFIQGGVEKWYAEKNRIQTEHPVLQESEAGLNLASFAFLSSPPEQAYRSLEAKELAGDRIRIERDIEALKLRKKEFSQEAYYQQLQSLLVELATLNERIRKLEGEL
jgi:hypothetical protein